MQYAQYSNHSAVHITIIIMIGFLSMDFCKIDEFQRKIKRIIITNDEIKAAVKKAGEMINS